MKIAAVTEDGTIYVTEGRQVAYGETLLDFED